MYKRAERGARRGGRPYKKRQEIRRQPLGPREAVFGERQGTNAFSGDAKDRVAHGGEDWRESGVAGASGGIFGFLEKGFDFRGGFVYFDRRVIVGNGFDGGGRVQGDFLGT